MSAAPTPIDAQTAFTGTVAPTGTDILDEAKLAEWMTANVAGFEGPVQALKFAGGQSNPTYRLNAKSGSYVLRRKPLGVLLPSAHAVDREYKVIAGLHPTGFPVAKPFGLCTDDSVIGSWFYIMDMVEGRTIWDGAMPGSNPAERTATYEAMIDTLAALHNTDVAAAGLQRAEPAYRPIQRYRHDDSDQPDLADGLHAEELAVIQAPECDAQFVDRFKHVQVKDVEEHGGRTERAQRLDPAVVLTRFEQGKQNQANT